MKTFKGFTIPVICAVFLLGLLATPRPTYAGDAWYREAILKNTISSSAMRPISTATPSHAAQLGAPITTPSREAATATPFHTVPSSADMVSPYYESPEKPVQLSVGEFGRCILTKGGTVKCLSNFVQLNNPVLNSAKEIAVGKYHACALMESGTVKCWGVDPHTFSYDTSPYHIFGPTEVPGISGVKRIASGGSGNQCCGLTERGTITCWYVDKEKNQINIESPILTGINEITVNEFGFLHCVLIEDGTVKCLDEKNIWTDVADLSGVKAISAGDYHNCALMENGTVKCWGNTIYGALGNGISSGSYYSTPIEVPGLFGVKEIAVAGTDTCAGMKNGTVKCWGYDFGDSPKIVEDLNGIKEIAMTYLSTSACFLMENGIVKCGLGGSLQEVKF